MSEQTEETQETVPDAAPAEGPDVEEPDTPATEPGETPPATPGEEPPEPAVPPEAPAAPGMQSEADVKKFQQAVERLFRDNAGKVGRIYADDATHLIECPFCIETAPGFIWDPSFQPISEGQQQAARLLLNIPVPTDYQESPVYRQCQSCSGKGSVRTGSLVPNNETAMCPECKGKGFIYRGQGAQLANGNGHEEPEPALTGPTAYTGDPSRPPIESRPEVEALRAEGYLVVEPMAPLRPAS